MYIIDGLISFACLLVYCLATHIAIAWTGLTYCESTVSMAGNEDLFNNLEESLVIIDDITKEIIFCNREATLLMVDP